MSDDSVPPPESRRRAALLAVAALVLAAAAAFAVWWVLVARHRESTDNAYVQAPVVQVTAQVGGTVVAVLADDTDRVQAGQLLVKLDAADARLALERAEAQLAQTVREVRGLYAGNATQDATIRLRQAEVQRAEAEVQRAEEDVARRRPLLATGAVGAEEFQHAEAALAAAQSALAATRSALAAAREQASGQRALTDGTVLDRHPSVERAAAAVREAYLALARCELPAPLAGQVARRTVQVGQRVAAGAPLMAVVPLEQAWVEANFKEGQLRSMRVGQPVALTADLYGGKVEYHGRVVGLGAGTGAAFALLPAQNATGNWIKVVQRVPVRIELDRQQLAAHPLRVGLSMQVVVDTRSDSGAPVASGEPGRAARASTTVVFDAQRERADLRVEQIVRANLGRSPRGAAEASGAQGVSGAARASGAAPPPLVSASR